MADALDDAGACLRFEAGATPSRALARPLPEEHVAGLSEREVEVLRLLANGMSNQQIADSLFISLRTVTNHVTHVNGEIEIASRTAAAAYAIRNGIA